MKSRLLSIMIVLSFSVLVFEQVNGIEQSSQNIFGVVSQLPERQADIALPEGAFGDWWEAARKEILETEYKITWQDRTYLPDINAAYQAPNRDQGLRTYFTPEGIRVIPRTKAAPGWQWGTILSGYGYAGDLHPVEEAALNVSGNRIEYKRGGITEWYVNDKNGLEQGFTLKSPPYSEIVPSDTSIILQMRILGDLALRKDRTGDTLDFYNAEGQRAIRYGKLHASDASGKQLSAYLSGNDGQLFISIDTTGARFPITIDPIIWGENHEPDWTYTGPLYAPPISAKVGFSVATAGDVNGDGYSDVVVGAPYWDSGQNDEGMVFVFYGSAAGLTTGNSWSAEGNQENASFGYAVHTAGDVNNDGYSDIIVGAINYSDMPDNEGAAFVYHGSSTGLDINGTRPSGSPGNADWSVEGDQANAGFGNVVNTAGDVNGDGFADVIVGAYYYDNGHPNEGAIFVYHGSPTGLSTNAWFAESDDDYAYFGVSAATAGDVNGDGYSDIVVGAHFYANGQTREGAAVVFHGSSTGLNLNGTRPTGNLENADWMVEGNHLSAQFGCSVSTAGDVDGDGYSDVVIGAKYYTAYGTVFVYSGSPTGLNINHQWYARGDIVGGYFGSAVATAGDVNGDGYADIIVGSTNYDNAETNEGAAFVYLGSITGLDFNGTRPTGSPGNADWMDEGDQGEAFFGWSVATAGDVNGDGYSEIIVGMPYYDRSNPPYGSSDTGKVAVYYGSAEYSNPNAYPGPVGYGYRFAPAGDVNGDGYTDIIVGDPSYSNGELSEGAAHVFYGSASGPNMIPDWNVESNFIAARLGESVSTAGDVNGDGYDDVIIGAPEYYPNPSTQWGAALIYYGSATGLGADGTPANADWIYISDFYPWTGGHFGSKVASTGDINGDGYADIIVGAPNVLNYSDRFTSFVSVFYGSPSGPRTDQPDWRDSRDTESGNNYGCSMGSAGDVNGDGYDDIYIGNPSEDPYELEDVLVYYGSKQGIISTAPDWTADGGDEYSESFGDCMSTAGDVNGDGYSDFVVGARWYEGIGAAFLYYGSASGLGPNGTPANAGWMVEGSQYNELFGFIVEDAGDFNGDGFSDLMISSPYFDSSSLADAGAVYLYFGSESGPSIIPDWMVEGTPTNQRIGQHAAALGDGNGDGFADVLPDYSVLYYGNFIPGRSLIPRQRKSDDSGPIARLGMSDSDEAFSLSLQGWTPYGRSLVKMEWEVKPLGTLFDGQGTQKSMDWIDTETAGIEINELVAGLSGSTLYHWRMRLVYHPATTPFQQHSRWLTVPWNGWQEADLRTMMTAIPFCEGDLDEDGDIDGWDLTVFIEEFNLINPIADFNNDGSVDELDVEIFAHNFGKAICP